MKSDHQLPHIPRVLVLLLLVWGCECGGEVELSATQVHIRNVDGWCVCLCVCMHDIVCVCHVFCMCLCVCVCACVSYKLETKAICTVYTCYEGWGSIPYTAHAHRQCERGLRDALFSYWCVATYMLTMSLVCSYVHAHHVTGV